MKFSEYVEKASETAIYPDKGGLGGLNYVVMGLAGELGEVFEVLKKIYRDDAGEFTPAKIDRLASEVGDVYWYLSQTSREVAKLRTEGELDLGINQVTSYERFKEMDVLDDSSLLEQQRFFLSSAYVTVGEILSICADLVVNDTINLETAFNEIMLRVDTIITVLMIFLSNIDLKIDDVLQANLDKLSARKAANKIGGSGETLEER